MYSQLEQVLQQIAGTMLQNIHGIELSATHCRYLMNILHHYPGDFAAELAPGYTCNILVSQPLQHEKEMLCCQCE